MNRSALSSALCGLLLVIGSAFAGDVMVNGVALDDSTRQTLERGYEAQIKPGRYWYDTVSGV